MQVQVSATSGSGHSSQAVALVIKTPIIRVEWRCPYEIQPYSDLIDPDAVR